MYILQDSAVFTNKVRIVGLTLFPNICGTILLDQLLNPLYYLSALQAGRKQCKTAGKLKNLSLNGEKEIQI